MKKSKSTKLLFGFLGIATFASLVGTVSGTLAWYTYSTRASLSYSGTSVNNTVQLQIGIASTNKVLSVQEIREENERKISENPEMSDEAKQELHNIENLFVDFWDVMSETKWDGDSNYYYFAPLGSGLSSSAINSYLYSNGYATNSLAPSTSGAYKRGDAFSLKASPNPESPRVHSAAYKADYATIPFVFRVIRSNTTESNKFVAGSELWLTGAQVRASSSEDGEVYKALRLFVDRGNDYEDDFILNPSAASKGSTVVAGLLDLTRDNYYDYDADNNEIIYGDYESIDGIKSSYSGGDVIDDVNGTGKAGDDFDTFTAKHRPGINYYDNYDSCVFETAEFESLGSIAPIKDEISGVLRNKDINRPSSVCKTGDSNNHYLGRVDFTIYLEGWDHSLIDKELLHYFDLGLTFEINKL